jgi:hypothetical protein
MVVICMDMRSLQPAISTLTGNKSFTQRAAEVVAVLAREYIGIRAEKMQRRPCGK